VKTHIEAARELLENASSIVIITHARPDGDAIASLLALHLSLNDIGKRASAVLLDEVPHRFRALPGAERIRTAVPDGQHLLIAVDCADPKRISLPESDKPETVDINIDHHPTNPNFGRVNLLDPEAASTTQVLYDLMPELNLPITRDVASNLMAGLVTDTIGFRTESVSSKVFSMAAALLELGVPLAEIYEKSLTQQSFASVRYWGCGLSRINREDAIVWTSLYLEDRASVGYRGNDDADLTNLMSAIEGVDVSIIFIEQSNGKVKISFRSREIVNVANLAEQFGGGGHAAAAGVMLEGGMDEIIERVLAATREIVLANPERTK
jgi:phosphoesterase RecJ-like protein